MANICQEINIYTSPQEVFATVENINIVACIVKVGRGI